MCLHYVRAKLFLKLVLDNCVKAQDESLKVQVFEMRKYDVAAFIWPAYTGDEPRTRIFWPKGMGEWESVEKGRAKYDGHLWPRKPLWGYVNEADPYVMEMQINAAADHGVNVFIYDWYWFDNRPFLENCLNDGYLKARNNHRVKFYVMWANHNVDYTWDIRLSDSMSAELVDLDTAEYMYTGGADRAMFETVSERLIERYFKHPNYYRIDGKPVFMIFSLPVLVDGLGGLKETQRAFQWLKQRCTEAGLGGLHLQLNIHNVCTKIADETGRIVPTGELIEYLGFDSTTNYQLLDLVEDADRDYADVAEDSFRTWERHATENPVPYFPQVSVGWDNNLRFKELKRPIITGGTPEKFRRALQKARDFVDARPEQPALITINSWNEWTEGSYLEPDNIFGYGYLEAVRDVFGECP